MTLRFVIPRKYHKKGQKEPAWFVDHREKKEREKKVEDELTTV